MSFITCFDAVEMVLNEAADRIGPAYRLNKNAVKQLRVDCKDIDAVVRDAGASSMEAELDDESLVLSVTIICDDMILEYGRQHPFFRVIQHADSFTFHNTGDDSISITFRFHGVFLQT